MRKIKPLKKLSYRPHSSEVFYCSSIGIDADCINPEIAIFIEAAKSSESSNQLRGGLYFIYLSIFANTNIGIQLYISPVS